MSDMSDEMCGKGCLFPLIIFFSMDIHFMFGASYLALAFIWFGFFYDRKQGNEIGIWEAFFYGGVVTLFIVACIVNFGNINI